MFNQIGYVVVTAGPVLPWIKFSPGFRKKDLLTVVTGNFCSFWWEAGPCSNACVWETWKHHGTQVPNRDIITVPAEIQFFAGFSHSCDTELCVSPLKWFCKVSLDTVLLRCAEVFAGVVSEITHQTPGNSVSQGFNSGVSVFIFTQQPQPSHRSHRPSRANTGWAHHICKC